MTRLRIGRPGLLASSSLLALIGATASASAACIPVSNLVAISCINLNGGSHTGNLTNDASGLITPLGAAAPSRTGITINNSTLIGSIINAGIITAANGNGITVTNHAYVADGITNSGTISVGGSQKNGIFVGSTAGFGTISTFAGGILNTGTILVGGPTGAGINLSLFSSFAGGIVNQGRITGPSGIVIGQVSSFTGGILNSGTISASAGVGINVGPVSFFSGGIGNSGTISASGNGIALQGVDTFLGGIANIGTITAHSGAGISAGGASTFSGGIVNAGKISAGFSGIGVTAYSTFSGGISNSGTITAGGAFGGNGILVINVTSFSGGISNSGTISVVGNGAGINLLNVSEFSGGITNSGSILTGSSGAGIVVGATQFSGNISNSGTITGRTGIYICNCVTFVDGAIINTGNITASVAAINASHAPSAITIDQLAGTLTGAIKLSSHADVLNVFGGAINGNIIGQGVSNTLNFALGSGTFTYGAAYGISGVNQVNVESGAVILEGANSATNVTVTGGLLQIGDESNPGATLTSTTPVDVAGGVLAGHGTIDAGVVVQNGAMLMPGGSIGTLTINGNLLLSSGSTYAVEFSSTQASKAQVNGAATLGGATFEAVVTANQFGFHKGGTYTVLTATTPLGPGNTFNPAVTFGLPSSEKFLLSGAASLSYDANDVFLTVPNYLIGLAAPANAPLNAQNVAGGINSFLLGGGALPAGFQNLVGLSGNALGNALGQLAGQAQGAFGPVGFEAGNQFLNLILNPYIDGRPGPATSPAPLAYAEQQSSAPAAKAFNALSLGPRSVFDPRLSFWTSAYGGDGTISGNGFSGAASTNSQIYGVATGVDYLALPNTIFGLALGGGGTAWQLGQAAGSGHSTMFQAGLYGRSQLGPAYVAGAFAYSLHDVTTNRSVTLAGFDSLQGDFSANVLSMRLEGGYRLPYGVVAVTPYGALQSQDMFLPAYSEFTTSGASQFGLSYANRTFAATRTEIGAWFDSDALMASGIKLYSRLAWAHDFDNEGTSFAFFQSLPGSNFLINSSKPARDGALTTAGFEYRLVDGWSVLGKFDGEFSSTTAIFAGTGTIRKVW